MAPANPLVPSGIARWSLKVTGSFAVTDPSSGREVTPRGRKACAIIAYLSVRPDVRIAREKITELLWGDRGEAQARASLRQALLEIRHATAGGPELIGSDRGHVWVNGEAVEIRSAIPKNGEEEFVAFEDLDHISREFDDWLEIERACHKRELSARMRKDLEHHLAEGSGPAAMNLVEAMWRIDPYDEDALRLALQAEHQAGHPAGVEQRFQTMEILLREDLGVEPAAETRALRDRLLGDLKERKTLGLEAPKVPAQPGGQVRRWSWRSIVAAALVPIAALALMINGRGGLAGAEPKRIAVLPFEAFEGVEPVIAEGLAEELLAQLSRHGGIQTIGRTSSWMFKDTAEDLRRVGNKLNADFIVEGSVRQANGGLQATITLIDAGDASILWTQRFVSASGDLQRIESAAGGALMKQLGLIAPVPLARTDPRAYANYVRAKALIRDRDWAKMREARDLLREAVKFDPNFAPAWAQLGGAINLIGSENKMVGGEQDPSWRREALAAAERSIALDPNLAEGHAMVALIHGFDTDKGRAHLVRAVVLDPNNPQTIYWSGIAAGYAGDFAANERAVRRALELDPLWRRPIEVAGKWAIWRGNRDEAYGYVERLRSADLSAAVEIEMSFARAEGDLSRVVQIGRQEPMIASTTAAKLSLAWSLIELGYVQEGLLLGQADPFDRLLYQGRLPDRQAILSHLRPFIGYSEEYFMVEPVVIELVRRGRCGDVAAIYDLPNSRLRQLSQIKDGNRDPRLSLAGLVGWCMARIDRVSEANQLLRAADEAGRVILANRVYGSPDLIGIATNDAILGRRQQALTRLEQAVAGGWIAFEGFNFELSEAPWFASLRGDPRFERLRATTKARLQKERRETEALGVI